MKHTDNRMEITEDSNQLRIRVIIWALTAITPDYMHTTTGYQELPNLHQMSSSLPSLPVVPYAGGKVANNERYYNKNDHDGLFVPG